MNTVADVLNIAESQVGTGENPPGSNHVKYWDDIGRSDLQGNPWCAAFVTWCMKQAGVPFPAIDTPGGYVYCPDAVTFGRAHGELVTDPQPGDIVLFDWEHDSIADHTGLVVSVSGDSFNTVEGNAGDPGSVMANAWPNHSLVTAFFRPPYGSGAPSGPTPVTYTSDQIATLRWLIRRHGMLDTVPGGNGFAVARPDGAVDSYEGAPNFGSMYGHKMNAPIVGFAFTHTSQGYWLLGVDGGVFALGDAQYHGPAKHFLTEWGIGIGTLASLVGIRRGPDGNGDYVLVADNPTEPAAREYHITADNKFKD